MSKLWLVALNEFQRNVFKKSFILALLSVPLMIGLNVGLGIIMESLEDDNSPVGFVDQSGLLTNAISASQNHSEDPIEFISFQSVGDARKALEAEEIQAYYMVSPDYQETNKIELVYLKEPGKNATRQFYDFIQASLLRDQPNEVSKRAVEGTDVTIRSPDGSREFPAGGPTLGQILLIIISVAFLFLIMMSSGYLMSGVVEEKQNRTIEVLMTSLSPLQFIAGKVLGIVAIGFIQLATWILVGILGVYIGGNVLGFEWFRNPSIELGSLMRIVAIAIPSYVLSSTLMFALGATIAEDQEGQSVGALFFMLHMIPIYLIVVLVEQPNSALAIALSTLPFTSLLAVSLRSLFSVVPVWQVGVSVGVQILFMLGALWLAARAFRFGMLRYGQSLKLAELIPKRKVTAKKANPS